MSVLLKFFAALTPPSVSVQEEYDDLQWRWKMFVFRPACMSFCDTWTVGLILYVYRFYLRGIYDFGAHVLCFVLVVWIDEEQASGE